MSAKIEDLTEEEVRKLLCVSSEVKSSKFLRRSKEATLPISPEQRASLKDYTPQDDVEIIDEELLKFLQPREQFSDYHPLDFKTSSELLAYIDKNMQEGETDLYLWQAEINDFLSKEDGSFSKQEPLEFLLCACNGSGKDAFVIAPFAIWHCLTKIRSRCIITSSSYRQMHGQTEKYISYLASLANKVFSEQGLAEKVFIIKKEHIVCTLTGSEIVMFVTDDPGQAEGYHPFPDYPRSELCIIINEAKTVSDEIFNALRRCTGYNRWIEVSSPGRTDGHFYKGYCRSAMWPESYDKLRRYSRKVTAYECYHISEIEINRALEELDISLFRSIYLAEFTSVNDQVVITLDKINQCIKSPPKWDEDTDIKGGLDLSLGGDETVLVTRRGNKPEALDPVKHKDATVLVVNLEIIFHKRGYVKKKTKIFTDIGGLGKPIYDMLVERGWNCIPVLNNRVAINNKLYGNGGTEDWFRVGSLINKGKIIIWNDTKLITQLSSRYYNQPNNDKIRLESKKEARANGHASPDRADAYILAFLDYEPREDVNDRAKRVKDMNNLSRVTQETLLKAMEERRFAGDKVNNRITRKDMQRSWLTQTIQDWNHYGNNKN